MTHKLSRNLAAFALVLLTASAVVAEDGVEELVFAGGSRATILSAEFILENYVSRSGAEAVLELPGMPPVELVIPLSQGGLGTEDRYYPHSGDAVREALESLDYPRPVEEIEILILPYPRANMPVSSALGRRIFLSPAPAPTPFQVSAFTCTHELGHLFQYSNMPDSNTDLWSEYRRLRGITDTSIYNENAAHADRPHEIFAEDFRALFGGEAATYSGTIENRNLPHPGDVEELEDFFLALGRMPGAEPQFRASCFPNPFNPRTAIRVDADASMIGQAVLVQVFDARGRRVRDIFSGPLYSHSLSFDFQGLDDGGRRLPSGVYFTSVRIGDCRQTTKMVLLQ